MWDWLPRSVTGLLLHRRRADGTDSLLSPQSLDSCSASLGLSVCVVFLSFHHVVFNRRLVCFCAQTLGLVLPAARHSVATQWNLTRSVWCTCGITGMRRSQAETLPALPSFPLQSSLSTLDLKSWKKYSDPLSKNTPLQVKLLHLKENSTFLVTACGDLHIHHTGCVLEQNRGTVLLHPEN